MTEIPQQRMVQVPEATVEAINLALTLVCTWINELGGFGGGAPIANLVANRLVCSDGNSAITSVTNLAAWILGYAGRITVTDLGDGRVQVAIPDTPALSNVLLSQLSPLRLTATSPTGAFASVRDLMEWMYGYPHRILLDNSAGDGTIIVKTPQDIDVDSSPTFAQITATSQVVLLDTQSPAHRWGVTVDNTGALVTTDLGI